jgi:hypothetical protein
MLRAQLPATVREKIAAELKIDLKLVSATIKERTSPESLYQDVRLVEEYLQREGLIGTVDTPLAYFRGTMPMRWGLLDTMTADAVYFTGEQDRVIVGLGGSRKHVIGGGTTPPSGPIRDSSEFYAIVSVLSEALSDDGSGIPKGWKFDHPLMSYPLRAVELAEHRVKGVDRRVEFVAKTLLHGPGTRTPSAGHVILGSPLYVALLEDASPMDSTVQG